MLTYVGFPLPAGTVRPGAPWTDRPRVLLSAGRREAPGSAAACVRKIALWLREPQQAGIQEALPSGVAVSAALCTADASLVSAGVGVAAQESPDRQAHQDRHDHRARHALLADGVDREHLAIGQVDAEAEAAERQRRRRKPRRLAFRGQQRREDRDVADQPDQRHRHAGELGVERGLHLRAAFARRAHRLDPRVVDVGQVAGDARDRARVRTISVILRARALIGASSFRSFSTASLTNAGSLGELYSSLLIAPPLWPIRNDGVPLKPSLLAAWASVATSLASSWLAAVAGPLREVQPGHLAGDALDVFFGHVARVLFSLLVVEGLDEVPRLVLLARRVGRHLLGLEDFRFARRRLQRVVFDPQLARAHPLRDDRRQRAERELLADRALQVAEVLRASPGPSGGPSVLPLWGMPPSSARDFGGRRGPFVFRRRDAAFGSAAGGDRGPRRSPPRRPTPRSPAASGACAAPRSRPRPPPSPCAARAPARGAACGSGPPRRSPPGSYGNFYRFRSSAAKYVVASAAPGPRGDPC